MPGTPGLGAGEAVVAERLRSAEAVAVVARVDDGVGLALDEAVGLSVAAAVGDGLGGAVVGAGVGRGVGLGVGGGVGCGGGVASAWTTIVPIIPVSEWIWQKYGYVPGAVNRLVNVSPAFLKPESKPPLALGAVPEVTVCVSPANVHVTLSPT